MMAVQTTFATTVALPVNTPLLLDVAKNDVIVYIGYWWDGNQWWQSNLPVLPNCYVSNQTYFNSVCSVVRVSSITGPVTLVQTHGELDYFSLAIYRNVYGTQVNYDDAGFGVLSSWSFNEYDAFKEFLAVVAVVGSDPSTVTGPSGLVKVTGGNMAPPDPEFPWHADVGIWQVELADAPTPEMTVTGDAYLHVLASKIPALPVDPGNSAPVGSGQFPIA